MNPGPALGVGAIIVDESGRLLMVRRGRGVGEGLWSIPGGHVEAGETVESAVEREVAEETGLTVACGRFVGWVQLIGSDHHYVIMDFEAGVVGDNRSPRAGDDAAECRWMTSDEVVECDLVPALMSFLVEHRYIDRPPED